MKRTIAFLLFFVVLQACNIAPKVPLCEPNDETQYEYNASSSDPNVQDSKLRVFTDYDAGIACAQRQNKPVFIGFIGYSFRTRFFPDIVLLNPIIVNYLLQDFIPIFLYMNDYKKLPLGQVEEVVEEDGSTIHIRTLGNRNAHLQKTMFQQQSQPYLVWMTWDGELLTAPLGYQPDVNDYVEAFYAAFEAFNERK